MPTVRAYRPIPTATQFLAGSDALDLGRYDDAHRRFAAAMDAAGDEQARGAVERATRWAAVDTGALEGLYETSRGVTWSIAATAESIAQMQHPTMPKPALMHIEDALAAYDHMLDLATGSRPLNEYSIKELHAIICRSQPTYTVNLPEGGSQERSLDLGSYKLDPNFPYNFETDTVHMYAAPGEETSAEMRSLIEQLDSQAFRDAPGFLQAAYSHYAFVNVHPFPDGNGRVARALASTFMYRDPGIPLVIFIDQRTLYLGALEEADTGNYMPFIRFTLARAIETMTLLSDLLENRSPAAATSAAALRSALENKGGLTDLEVNAVEPGLRSEWRSALEQAISDAGNVKPITLELGQSALVNLPSGTPYRKVPGAKTINLAAKAPRPTFAQVEIKSAWHAVQLKRAPDLGILYVLMTDGPGEVLLSAPQNDVYPNITDSLRFRLRAVAERVVDEIVDLASAEATLSLQQSTYLNPSLGE